MRELAEIALAVKAHEPVSPQEYAHLLHNNREAFLAFLIANNPGGVTNVLRHKLGYTHELGFKPDHAQLGRICQILIDRKDEEALSKVAAETPINLKGLSPDLIQALKNYK